MMQLSNYWTAIIVKKKIHVFS